MFKGLQTVMRASTKVRLNTPLIKSPLHPKSLTYRLEVYESLFFSKTTNANNRPENIQDCLALFLYAMEMNRVH